MLEMREREGSDVLGAREDRGKWGREASKHLAEVDIPQERVKEVSQYSAEVDAPQARQGGSLDIQQKTVRQNSVACVGTPAQQCKKEREMGHKRSYRDLENSTN